MYMLSPKIKSEGDITRISPNDGDFEYFFGYYDKSPEDATGRYVLCLRAENTWSNVAPAIPAQILLIDTAKEESVPDRVRVLATTRAWNVQQGCMMQWLGPDFDHDIIYNDFRDGEYVSVILNVFNGEEKVLQAPVYSVSQDGCFALTLDFSRLHRMRPGYGYSNKPDKTEGQKIPDGTAIWRLDLQDNVLTSVLAYSDFVSFEPRPEMENAEHKVNHIMLNPCGKRFMVLHRWFDGQRKYTRLLTVNTDGTSMYNLSDDDMVSHCYWKDNRTIIAFENKKGQGAGYYLMTDLSQSFKHLWPNLCNDGHPSFSPDGCLVLTDTYPDRRRIAEIKILDETSCTVVARVFSPFKYNNETRCDLHPRWSKSGKRVYFDSAHEGHRGLYSLQLSNLESLKYNDKGTKEKNVPKYTIITPVYNSFELMTRYFDSLEKQTYKNFEVILIDDCSNDGSFEKICEYAKNTILTISIYRTAVNRGPGEARNIGMDYAKGDWVTFIDNDDWVEPCFLAEIDKVIINKPVQAVIYDFYVTNGKKNKTMKSMYCGQEGYVTVSNCISYTRNHTFGKVYHRIALEEMHIRYPSLRRCEDVAFVDRALAACKDVYYLKKPMYYYYRRASSLSNQSALGEADMVKAFSYLEDELGKLYPEELKEKSVSDLLYGSLLMMCKSGKSDSDIYSFLKCYEENNPEWDQYELVKYLGKQKSLFLKMAKHRNIKAMRFIAMVHSLIIKRGYI